MKNNNNLLILEMSSSPLSVANEEKKDYVLEGIFGEIDVKNKNQRIYTESEYVPQIESLQQKIKAGKLLGELDHPSQFDVSLKNVSHIIEELYYDKEKKQVKGKIRLLDTDAGKQAKALVDAGVPLQISSRAAGAVESNGTVKIKQLFTYDLVADPGFENAELKRVNESYGFSNENGLYIYEINNTENNNKTQIIENKDMADFVNADDFNKYTEYLAKEIKSIKESMEASAPKTNAVTETELKEVKAHNDHIVESVNGIKEYIEYVSEKLDQSIQYTEHVAEKADQGIAYSESLAEKLDETIQYAEHVAEKTDQSIQYSEHLAEGLSKIKEYANYLAESHNESTTTGTKLVEYVDYLKSSLQSVTEYAEYVAETVNTNLLLEDEKDLNLPAEELESELDDKTPKVKDADGKKYAKAEDRSEETEEVEDDLVDGEDGAKKVAEGKLSWDHLIEKINEEVFDSEMTADYNSVLKTAKKYGIPIAVAMATVAAMGVAASIVLIKKGAKAVKSWLEQSANESVGESAINDPVLIAFRAAKIKRERELSNSVPTRKPLYGKQREKAQDTLWDINLEIKDLYQDRDQLFYDMDLDAGQKGEEWTDADANEYGLMLNNVEAEIEKLLTKRTQLEVKLAESAMYVNLNEDLRNDLKRYIKSNQKELDNFADNDDWDRLYDTLLTDFGVDDHESEEADELKTIFNMVY